MGRTISSRKDVEASERERTRNGSENHDFKRGGLIPNREVDRADGKVLNGDLEAVARCSVGIGKQRRCTNEIERNRVGRKGDHYTGWDTKRKMVPSKRAPSST